MASLSIRAGKIHSLSFADAAASIAECSVDQSDMLWIVFSGGGSSVFELALTLNHWKTVAAIFATFSPPPGHVIKHVTCLFFKVQLLLASYRAMLMTCRLFIACLQAQHRCR
jgi:hypothetical protein